jgi:hypothetical protein
MAGGAIAPFSVGYDSNGRVYPGVHVGATNGRQDTGHKVEASLGADAVVHLRFLIPEVLPSGTLTLLLIPLANATSGAAKGNPSWAAVNRSLGPPDTATLYAEGTTTVTWAAGENDEYKATTITLDATTLPTAGQVVVMSLTFETSGWTLAVASTWQAFLIYV